MKSTTTRAQRFAVLPGAAWLVIALQIALWSWLRLASEKASYQSLPETILGLSVSLVVIAASFHALNLMLPSRVTVRRWANLALVLAFGVLFTVHFFGEQSLDFYLLGDNFAELFFSVTVSMLVSHVSLEHWLIVANVMLVLGALAFMTSWFTEFRRPRRTGLHLAGSCLILVGILATPAYPHSDMTFFWRSAIDYAFGLHSTPGLPTVAEYPYVKRSDDKPAIGTPPLPHVFILAMESFNANFVEAKTSNGQEYTPFFNSLIGRGVYVERFYGNSVQTSRGHNAILTSIIPSFAGKIHTNYPNLRLRALPAILRSSGYCPMFFQTQADLQFDNTNNFMRHLGFDEVYGMQEPFITAEERRHYWGFGLQDDKFYARVFRHLDGCLAQAPTKPYFSFLATCSHHWPFNAVPVDQRILYPKPESRKQQFANSIRLADRYLEEFFRQLASRSEFANSLIVICGDHSFPAGEHGIYFNEQGWYEENFRTPMLVIWNGMLKPRRITTRAYSQLDIAPTILDLLSISEDTHFLGQSVFDPRGVENRPVYLVQPYGGTFLAVVRYPYKYVKSLRLQGEYLFDLSQDPSERVNRIDEFRSSKLLAEFQRDLLAIQLNQHLIERNRIWQPQLTDGQPARVTR